MATVDFKFIYPGQTEEIMQVKRLFPCGCLPFEETYDAVWFDAFEKTYHYPGKRFRNAIAFCHCRFNESGYIKEIIQ